MDDFDAVDFPLAIGREAEVITEFATQIIAAPSGHEQRVSEWADARMHYDAGPGVRGDAELAVLVAFFRARRGAARGFRFRDPIDHSSLPVRVRLRAGCDKRLETCATRFANAANFRGEAHLPGFDLLTRYPGG